MILCVMRIPPALDGHGGSQRAWRLVEALRRHGRVHFVLVCRKTDKDAASVSLAPLEPHVESVTTIDIPEWQATTRAQLRLPRINTQWADLARFRCHEAPAISAGGLARIAAQLPARDFDLVFAGRLPSAVIAQSLIDRGQLRTRAKVVDFDDIMSRFRDRQRRFDGGSLGHQGRLIARIDTVLIRRAERRIATSWGGVSVCTDEDVQELRESYPAAHVVKAPNVIDRPALPPRAEDGTVRLLFVGNLSFFPNIQGLRVFVEEAWPLIRRAVPRASLSVVGLHPGPEVRQLLQQHGLALNADVPSVAPYYAESDIVLAPILFGSGTRIKILEAMAYNRPVVSTALGAEGLDLVSGRHLLIADAMAEFGAAVVRLAQDRGLRLGLAQAARDFVAREYGVPALETAVDALIAGRPAPAEIGLAQGPAAPRMVPAGQ